MKQLLNNSSIKTSDEYFDPFADVRPAQRAGLQVIRTSVAHCIVLTWDEYNVSLLLSTVQTAVFILNVHLLGTDLSSQTLIGNSSAYLENIALLDLKGFGGSKRWTQTKPSSE
jgi:hypothetical protein